MSPALHAVAIHGAPRSGTSWLGQLFNSCPTVAYRYQPFFSHAFRGRIGEASDAGAIGAFFSDLVDTTDDFVLQQGAGSLAAAPPAFDKVRPTHLVYKEVRFHQLLPILLERMPALRAIGIVRDPRSVIASWTNAPREFDPAWSIEAEWRSALKKNAGLDENWYGYDRWKQLAQLFQRLHGQHPARLHLVRYEDLVASTEQVVEELFHFVGLEMGRQTRAFLDESRSRDDGDPYGVFRRHAGSRPGIGDIPARIARQIEDDLRGTALARYLEPPR